MNQCFQQISGAKQGEVSCYKYKKKDSRPYKPSGTHGWKCFVNAQVVKH